jgi:hypothetical protein
VKLKEFAWEGMHWLGLAQDRVKWWALWNVMPKLQVEYNVGNFFTSEVFQEELCSMEVLISLWHKGH